MPLFWIWAELLVLSRVTDRQHGQCELCMFCAETKATGSYLTLHWWVGLMISTLRYVCDVWLAHGESFSSGGHCIRHLEDLCHTEVKSKLKKWHTRLLLWCGVFAYIAHLSKLPNHRKEAHVHFTSKLLFHRLVYSWKFFNYGGFLKTRNCFLENDCWYEASLFQVYIIMIMQ